MKNHVTSQNNKYLYYFFSIVLSMQKDIINNINLIFFKKRLITCLQKF